MTYWMDWRAVSEEQGSIVVLHVSDKEEGTLKRYQRTARLACRSAYKELSA